MDRPAPMKTIGIIGGMTAQATIEYYKSINTMVNKRLGGYDFAEILINSVNFGNIEYYVRNAKWDLARDHLLTKALAAQAGGAEILLCASNTMHKVLDCIEQQIDIPFIHIATPTIAEAKKHNLSSVGLLGTAPVMRETFLADKFRDSDIDVLIPEATSITEIDRILFDETSRGQVVKSSKAFIQQEILKLIERGAQGIVLGCTELFMLVEATDFPHTVILDTTKLHINAAVEMALKDSD